MKAEQVRFSTSINFWDFFQKQTVHGSMGIEINNADAKIHKFLKGVVCNTRITHPDYKAKIGVNPFVQGGAEADKGRIFIEFWCSDFEKVGNYVDYLNERIKTFEFWE